MPIHPIVPLQISNYPADVISVLLCHASGKQNYFHNNQKKKIANQEYQFNASVIRLNDSQYAVIGKELGHGGQGCVYNVGSMKIWVDPVVYEVI